MSDIAKCPKCGRLVKAKDAVVKAKGRQRNPTRSSMPVVRNSHGRRRGTVA